MPAWAALAVVVAAVTCYHVAWARPSWGWLAFGTAAGFFALRRLRSPRQAFYFGLLAGLGIFAPRTTFLWRIFGPATLALWAVMAFWHGLFACGLQAAGRGAGERWAWLAAGFFWCGLEYFRSEVFLLRFSWFPLGAALAENAPQAFRAAGVYGVGFATTLTSAAAVSAVETRRFVPAVAAVALGASWIVVANWRGTPPPPGKSVRVAGIQLEAPGVPEVLTAMNQAIAAHPEVQLWLLPEYTFESLPPKVVCSWVQRHALWLAAGGRQPLPAGGFRNTAWVVDPRGEVVFSQAKAAPIPFFDDGKAAVDQRIWDSPWGRIGVLICYDLSFRRVVDELVSQGAEALVAPAMDVESWGPEEHRLNARVSRLRALELGIPLFRVASSGVSQIVDSEGSERATAPFPGPGAVLSGGLPLGRRGSGLPWDHWMGPVCAVSTGLSMARLVWTNRRRLPVGAED